MRTPLSFLCLVLLALLGCDARAQQATATAEISPNPIAPNQIATYTITIDGGNPTGVPNLQLPPALGLTGGVSSQNEISIVNGVQSLTCRFSWPITGTQEGNFVIPAQEVSVGSTLIKTNEVQIQVAAGAQAPKPGGVDANQNNGLGQMEPILQLRMAKTEFYQGEIVPITATLYLPRALQLRRLGLIEVEKTDLAIQRFPQQAEQSLETLGNIRYIALTFNSSLSALKPGKMKVGPAKSEIIVDIPTNNSRGFPFGFMQMDQRKLTISASEISINVLPLPTEGRPKNFSGAVGDFTMSATTSNKEVMVGDPVAVDVTIEGQGNFDALDAPVLAEPAGWKTYPPKRFNVDTGDPNTADLMNRRVGFNQIVVPEKVMAAVPPFEFSFFSPRTKQYTHLRSQPIPISIKPSPNAPPPTTAGATSTTNATQGPPPNPAPEADITDILMPIPAQARWASTATPLLSDKRFLVVNAVLLAAFIGLIAWSVWQRIQQKLAHSVDHERRRLLHEVEAQGLSEAEFFRRAAHYIRHVAPGTTPQQAQPVMVRYEALNFAGPQAGAQAVNESDRTQVLTMLRELSPPKATPPALPKVPALSAMLVFGLCTLANAAPQDQYQAAAQALEKSDFKKAQSLAQEIVKAGDVGPEVFTVLGHASYKQGQPGIAAMWYQRAQMFPGSVPELRQNLRHIEEKIHFFTFERTEWIERFGLWLSRNTWIFMSTIGAWLAIFSIAFLVLGARKQLQVWAVITLIAGLFAVGLGAAGYLARPAAEDLQDLAFVTAPKAQAHTAASQVSGSVIPVPPGSVVRKLSERGSWTYLEIPQPGESLRGWLPSNQIEPWWPFEVGKLP